MSLHDRLATTLVNGIGRVVSWARRQRVGPEPLPDDTQVTLATDALIQSVDCDPDWDAVEEVVEELPEHEQEMLIYLGDQE